MQAVIGFELCPKHSTGGYTVEASTITELDWSTTRLVEDNENVAYEAVRQ